MNDVLHAWLQHPSHAVLLTGSAETTSLEAARASSALLGGHTEHLTVVSPDNKGTISIGQIRELIASFRLKVPGRAAIKRVAIIEQADAMSVEAQNALLKLLEEPPADSVLLLGAERPQGLLATIRSRLQILHLASEQTTPETEAVQLVKQALAGSTYDRLLLVDSTLKPREIAVAFVATLAAVAEATLEATARQGSAIGRWQRVLGAAYTAQEALAQNGNAKLVLTELMMTL